jgi:hypothetical protein
MLVEKKKSQRFMGSVDGEQVRTIVLSESNDFQAG